MADVNDTLSTAWGGQYIDDFVDRGRVKRVYMQADAPFRMTPDDFKLWSVRNAKGEMVPFTAFATSHWDYGSPRLERYNGVRRWRSRARRRRASARARRWPRSSDWSRSCRRASASSGPPLSYQERQAGAQTPLLYALSLLVVFLCLAALYESWTIPTAVLMVAPLGILGAILANTLRGMERDVYFQVAMLTTVGLTSKNAILIIEFAKREPRAGAWNWSRRRCRPCATACARS